MREKHIWRKLARPLALLFPIIYILTNKNIVLLLVGIVTAIAVALETAKFFSFRKLRVIYRSEEKKRISSLCLFLVAIFFTFLFFQKEIAITAINFLIVGDLAAWFVGTRFGKTRIIGKKTLEGALAFFFSALLIGIIFNAAFNFGLAFYIILAGALSATAVEIAPIGEDNLTVALISAIIMSVI